MRNIRNDTLLKLIAVRIKALRMERGITQEAFFCDTQIHIARIETAKINITISTLSHICQYFNISLSEFFKEMPKQ